MLIPRRCLVPKSEISESLGDVLNVPIRLQSFENMSVILKRTPLSIAAISNSDKYESLHKSLISPFPLLIERLPNAITETPDFNRRNDVAAFRRFSARLVSFRRLLPLSYHPGLNTSNALSRIISTAATIGSISL